MPGIVLGTRGGQVLWMPLGSSWLASLVSITLDISCVLILIDSPNTCSLPFFLYEL